MRVNNSLFFTICLQRGKSSSDRLDVQASVEPTGKQLNMLLHVDVTHLANAGFLPVVFVSLFCAVCGSGVRGSAALYAVILMRLDAISKIFSLTPASLVDL